MLCVIPVKTGIYFAYDIADFHFRGNDKQLFFTFYEASFLNILHKNGRLNE